MTARLLALFFALCFASAAEAQVVWSIPGSACVPDEATTRFDRHNVGNALVQHAAGNVDLIILTCPIAKFATTAGCWNLRLRYQDSSETSPTAFVRARIYKMAFQSVTPIPLAAAATSNSSAVTTPNTVGSSFETTFDFLENVYWVRVELERTTTNQTVIFHAVRLDQVACS
jgi:hypothetical protein